LRHGHHGGRIVRQQPSARGGGQPSGFGFDDIHPGLQPFGKRIAPWLHAFGEGVGASSRDGAHSFRRKGGDVECDASAYAVAKEIGPVDCGFVKHCENVPAAIDRAIGRGVAWFAAVAVAAQIDEDNPSAMGEARLDVSELAPEPATFAKLVQHHDRRSRVPCAARQFVDNYVDIVESDAPRQ